MVHGCTCHGMATLFAALEVATGKGATHKHATHKHAGHKHAGVKAWLARHPRFHLHVTATSASWINPLDRFLALITEDAARRGVFRSIADLVATIEHYLEHYNADPKPLHLDRSRR